MRSVSVGISVGARAKSASKSAKDSKLCCGGASVPIAATRLAEHPLIAKARMHPAVKVHGEPSTRAEGLRAGVVTDGSCEGSRINGSSEEDRSREGNLPGATDENIIIQ
jgi:hypothetical protein